MSSDETTVAPRTAAIKLFDDAKAALAEMSGQIAEAKKTLYDYTDQQGLDPAKKEDVDKAKQIYQSSLKVTVVDDPNVRGARELMRKMYGLYEKTFPIAEEREELEKLESLLEKNHDASLQATGAPFKEQWIMVQDKAGDVVAATNIITFSAARDPKVGKDVSGTTHLTYIFVDPRYRSLGLGDYALRHSEEEARKFVASTFSQPRDPAKINLIQIAEQNAPLELSMASSLTDTAGAKIDQFYRRKYFEGLGFREVGYHYTQLPLEPRSEGGEPGEGMNLIIRGLPGPGADRHMPRVLTKVSSDIMRFHLYNFFDRSVAAGQYEVESDPDWVKQKRALHGTLKVKPELDFMSLQKKAWDCMDQYVHGPKFSAEDFENATLGKIMHYRKIPALAAEGGGMSGKFAAVANANKLASAVLKPKAASSFPRRHHS